MKKAIQNILNSFNNDKKGYSGKKLTVVICVMAAHIKWIAMGDFSQLISVLTVDYATVLTLMGINVYDKKVNTPTETNQTNQ